MKYPRPRRVLSCATLMLSASGVLLASAPGCSSEGSEDPVASTPSGVDTQPQGPDSSNTGPTAGPSGPAPNGGDTAGGGSTATAGPMTPPGPTGPTGPTGGSGGSGGSSNVGGSGGTGGGDVGGSGPGGSGGSGSGGEMGVGGVGGAAGSGPDDPFGEAGGGGAPVDGPVGGDDVMPSAGCGETPPASDRYSIDVGGTMRDYIIAVPENYDPAKPYRLIFAWHPWGGSAQQVAGNGASGYYGLLGASGGEAILVSPEGLDFGGNGLGWGNEGGQDLDFMRAMIERFDSELCFDHNRMFSTGFSFGGMMSNAVACAGLARAVAPMAGNSSVSGCENGTQPVAYMGFHGDADTVVAISGGEAARDVFVERNGCGAGAPSDSDWCELAGANNQPCTCTTYEGCQDGYPVTWCQFTGSHTPAPNSGETIWNFFAQF